MASEPSQRELTPEERLFKIIQEGKADPAADEGKQDLLRDQPVVDGPPAEALDPVHEKKARRAMTIFGDPAVINSLKKKFFTSQTGNRLLLTCFVTFFLYFLSTQFIWKDSMSDAFMQKTSAIGAVPAQPLSGLFSNDGVNEDLSEVKKRNLFQPWRPEPVAEAPAVAEAPQSPSGTLAAAASQLKLSGIYMSDEPEALLEAIDEKKTYAVSKGSEIKGVQVKEVRADGVVLTDGQNDKVIQ